MKEGNDWLDLVLVLMCYAMGVTLIYEALTNADGYDSDRFIAGFAMGMLGHIYDVVIIGK